MNRSLIVEYVLLFLGYPLMNTSTLLADKPKKIDSITFEIDVANEVYLELCDELEVSSSLPGILATSVKKAHRSVHLSQQIGSSHPSMVPSSCTNFVQFEKEFEESYLPLSSKQGSSTLEFVISQIELALSAMELDGRLNTLKADWDI